MIVQLTGNIKYQITLDPSVWIFDDRKILFEEAFIESKDEESKVDPLEKAAERWEKEVLKQQINPPINKSITRVEKEKILKNSYVMPLDIFLDNAEVKADATDVDLETATGSVQIPLKKFYNSYAFFAIKGKPLKDGPPIHLYYKDGSNQDDPIKGIQKITII